MEEGKFRVQPEIINQILNKRAEAQGYTTGLTLRALRCTKRALGAQDHLRAFRASWATGPNHFSRAGPQTADDCNVLVIPYQNQISQARESVSLRERRWRPIFQLKFR